MGWGFIPFFLLLSMRGAIVTSFFSFFIPIPPVIITAKDLYITKKESYRVVFD